RCSSCRRRCARADTPAARRRREARGASSRRADARLGRSGRRRQSKQGVGVAMLSIRMRRMGSSKKPFFRVVVQEARSARDSSFVENLGTYHPKAKPAQVEINKERLAHWLSKGARPSDSVRTLIAKHLTKDLTPQAPVEAAQWRPSLTGARCARSSKSWRGRWSIGPTRCR